MGLFIAAGLLGGLVAEAGFLVERIVQFGEGVADFLTGDEQFEAIGQMRFIGLALGKRRDFDGKIGDERRLDQLAFDTVFEGFDQGFAAGDIEADLDQALG